MAVGTEKLRRMFESDSTLMLETLNQVVSALTEGTADREKIDRAFRAAHSIKSEAGFLEIPQVSAAAHALEDTLATIRAAGVADPEVPERISAELSELSDQIRAYRTPEEPGERAPDDSDHISVESLGRPEAGMLREARARNERLYRATVRMTCEPELRYPRAFLAVNNLEIGCAVLQVAPSLESLRNGKDDVVTFLLTTSGTESDVRRALLVDEIEVTEITELSYGEVERMFRPAPGEGGGGATALRVDAGVQEEAALFADELADLAGRMTALVRDSGDPNGELVTTVQRVRHYASAIRDRVDLASRVQLLDVIRELKPRLVAHAARQGKRIRFLVSGSGAVVFPAVAQAITDALLHLIRNSIDHGIDTIQRRAAGGKPPAGTVEVQVSTVGPAIEVRVRDDGTGIDEDALRRKTGETERSLLDILATPGFTVRSHADQSSGRGVGLDSVTHTIRDLLGGELSFTTAAGRGSVVTVSVPAASRLVNVLVVDSADGIVAIPTALVVEHHPLKMRRFKRDSFGGRYYNFRGESLPLITVFGRNPSDDLVQEGSIGIVVQGGGQKAAMIASGVVGEEAVVRDGSRRKQVFSKRAGKEVPFVFPPVYMVP